jgi:uncharacterized protein (AIM24 family)
MVKKIAGMMAGGLFNVKLEGTGLVAIITTHYDPLTLQASAGHPVFHRPKCHSRLVRESGA